MTSPISPTSPSHQNSPLSLIENNPTTSPKQNSTEQTVTSVAEKILVNPHTKQTKRLHESSLNQNANDGKQEVESDDEDESPQKKFKPNSFTAISPEESSLNEKNLYPFRPSSTPSSNPSPNENSSSSSTSSSPIDLTDMISFGEEQLPPLEVDSPRNINSSPKAFSENSNYFTPPRVPKLTMLHRKEKPHHQISNDVLAKSPVLFAADQLFKGTITLNHNTCKVMEVDTVDSWGLEKQNMAIYELEAEQDQPFPHLKNNSFWIISTLQLFG